MSRAYAQSAAMAPGSSGPQVAALLRQAVLYHLDNLAHENALFFAERLIAQDPKSPESTFLLALCHFRSGDFLSAYDASKEEPRGPGLRGVHLGRVYIFAQSCLALERHRDGLMALERCKPQWPQKHNVGRHTATTRCLIPDAATLSCLLGKLYRGLDDKRRAISAFEEALKLNPLMWDAFTSLCDMGVHVKVPNVFKPNESFLRVVEQDAIGPESKEAPTNLPEPLPRKSALRSTHHDVADPFDLPRTATFQDRQPFGTLVAVDTEENDFLHKIAAARSRMANTAPNGTPEGMETPPAANGQTEAHALRSGLHAEPPHAPARRTRGLHAAEAVAMDAPPKMGYRGIGKKKERPADANTEAQPATEPAPSQLRSSATALSGAERKRTISGHPVQPRQGVAEEPGAPQRRSARLNMFKPSITKTNTVPAAPVGIAATREMKKARPPISRILRPGSSGSSVGRVVSGNRKPVEDNSMDVDHVEPPKAREAAPAPAPLPTKPTEAEVAYTARVEEALKVLLDLLRRLGSGYLALSQYKCVEAIQSFNSIPRAQADTPWVLAQVGRAQYEQSKYAEAEISFKRLRCLAPNRLEDMEVYSTVLWHLKKETESSFLAHELVDAAWHSPHAWCALGNAWSLASDRDQALRCFKRATQLDPKFAYAYTLQGHEHLLNEEYDKALTSFRHAIAADRRHYNAYYGIGRVYEKLGNYDKAYAHFRSASIIHPTNPVLICCMGTALEKQKQLVQALQLFTRATELAPQAAQTRYMKARALLALGQLSEARKELMVLKDLAPDEATVHFLLGKLYKTLNDKSTAVYHLTVALSLDPKASQLIKKAIESLEDEDGFDDSMVA